ncbi:PINIT domain-domain-containing protein [Syncephalastrum racemosum]|uniref:PINIT domain-domain-containing protein n=1 Tax=Syncephalastrum racemosum TaxID=13706 RepID=A0A1X2HM31_SYNRA|nr:PINIT domain-domain-containing protein [Syncephalastrum racemosum]
MLLDMAEMADPRGDFALLERDLSSLRKVDLTTIVRTFNNEQTRGSDKIHVTGNKPELIDRIKHVVHGSLVSGYTERGQVLLRYVNQVIQGRSRRIWRIQGRTLIQDTGNDVARPSPSSHSNNVMRIQALANPVPSAAMQPKKTNVAPTYRFVKNPFVDVVKSICNPKECPGILNSRTSAVFKFKLNDEEKSLLQQPAEPDGSPSHQVRFYCTNRSSNVNAAIVEYPSICEIRVNGGVISAHALRGIKNRPGSVHPADITSMLNINGENLAELAYANAVNSYVASIELVRHHSVPSLLEKLKTNQLIPKETVLQRLKEKQEDADIVMESETVSTKCPLSFTRIQTPCRSSKCQHIQCFDGQTFLQMNEQTPTWSCPVCFRQMNQLYDELVVDGYFLDLLANTPSSTESIRIEADGRLSAIKEESPESEDFDTKAAEETKTNGELAGGDVVTILSDDDNNTNEESRPAVIKRRLSSTPPAQPPPPPKKQHAVIDLTLSSDEEDAC